MRELIVAEFITLDGVIQAPGGAKEDTEGDFQHGRWTRAYCHNDIGARFDQAMKQKKPQGSEQSLKNTRSTASCSPKPGEMR